MASGVLLQSLGNGSIWDNLGNALNNHSVFVYLRGTTTQVQVYSDATLTTPLSQPLLTGASGAGPGGIPGYVAGGRALDFFDATTSARTQVDPMSASNTLVATTFLLPSGGDDSAAMVAALAAGGLIVLGVGTFLWNTSVPGFSRSTPTRVMGSGVGKTIIKLSSGAPRAFDFNKIADYDTFNDIEISDLTVDCNSIGGQHHVILGTFAAGVQMTKINTARIGLRRLQTLNAPTDSTTVNHRLHIWIYVQVNAADNPCTMTDITVEDCDFTHGGNYGVGLGGTTNDGSPNGNLTHDRILVQRVSHDTGVPNTGASYSSTCVQVGSKDFGLNVTLRDCHSYNAGDIGFALLNSRYGQCENCTSTDARNAGFQAANFNTQMPIDQTHIFRSCHAKIVATNPSPSGQQGNGFLCGGTPSAQLGQVILDSCSFHSLATNAPPLGAALKGDATVRSVHIVGDFQMSMPSINQTLAADTTSGLVYFICPGVFVFRVSGVLRSNVAGTIALNGHVFTHKEVWINPPASADYTLDVDCHESKVNLAGTAVTSTYLAFFGPTSVPGNITVTGTTTNTLPDVTGLSASDMALIVPGQPVSGTGIAATATVIGVNRAAGSFQFGTLGRATNATSSNTAETITITPIPAIRGNWRMRVADFGGGDTTPFGCYVQKYNVPGMAAVASALMAIDYRLSFDRSDLSRLPAGSGNGYDPIKEIVDNGVGLTGLGTALTYHGVRLAVPGAVYMGTSGGTSTSLTTNSTTTVQNTFGRRMIYWPSSGITSITAVSIKRGVGQSNNTVLASNGPWVLEPGDVLALTITGSGNLFRYAFET